ncbi:MAG: leucine-rich repeat domain-containing protein, partial [Chloroflexota bacterium]
MSSTTAAMPSSNSIHSSTSVSCTSVISIPQSECESLGGLYSHTDGQNWITRTGWLSDINACNWYGVSCHITLEHVVALAFNNPTHGNNLSGPLPPQIKDLPALEALDLWKNKITSVPPEIGELSNLGFLNLSANQLLTLPIALTNIPTLTAPHVNIAYNAIEVTDPTLVAYLDARDPDWTETQTVSPKDITVTVASDTSLALALTPIAYMTDTGFYEIGISTDSGFAIANTITHTTVSKSSSSYTITGLSAGTDYFIRIRTKTDSHSANPNPIWSDYSPTLSTRTLTYDCSAVSEIPLAECQALVSLYDSTGGPNWVVNNWFSSNTPCSWDAVSCGSGRVTELALVGFGLVGSLPAEINNLTELVQLRLDDNGQSDSLAQARTVISQSLMIPDELHLEQLTKLITLTLSGNNFTIFPTPIFDLTNLAELDLSDNDLTVIPDEISTLPDLEKLNLEKNQLTTMPSTIVSLTDLAELDLSDNDLISLPNELGELEELGTLDLGQNEELGVFPTMIVSLTNLHDLDLTDTGLTTIPNEIGFLVELEKLDLDGNVLAVLPSAIASLTELIELAVSHNQLTTLPSEIENLEELEKLYIDHNLFTQTPIEVGNMNSLNHITVHNNPMTEATPESLFTSFPESQSKIVLDRVQLQYIPVEMLSDRLNLRSISMVGNQIESIDDTIVNFKQIISMNLSYNRLEITSPDVATYITERDPDWEKTQLIIPDRLGLFDVTSTSFEFRWASIADQNDDRYYVIRVVSSENFEQTSLTASSVVTYVVFDILIDRFLIENLTPNTAYGVSIRTGIRDEMLQSISSEYSEALSIITESPQPTQIPTVAPSTPTHSPTVMTSTPTRTPTVTPTPSPTVTDASSPTGTGTPSSTVTGTPSSTVTGTPSSTVTGTPSSTVTGTPSST